MTLPDSYARMLRLDAKTSSRVGAVLLPVEQAVRTNSATAALKMAILFINGIVI
jgi:hypothetical protein